MKSAENIVHSYLHTTQIATECLRHESLRHHLSNQICTSPQHITVIFQASIGGSSDEIQYGQRVHQLLSTVQTIKYSQLHSAHFTTHNIKFETQSTQFTATGYHSVSLTKFSESKNSRSIAVRGPRSESVLPVPFARCSEVCGGNTG